MNINTNEQVNETTDPFSVLKAIALRVIHDDAVTPLEAVVITAAVQVCHAHATDFVLTVIGLVADYAQHKQEKAQNNEHNN